MQRGHVIAPTGDLIYGVTPYECGLCVGDHHRDMNPKLSMLPMLAAHLVNFAGEEERQRQYACYQSDIDQIGKEARYDFMRIINIVKQCKPETGDLAAALAKNLQHKSDLRDELMKFRQDFPMRIITRGLLCNYATVHEVLKVYADESRELYKASGNYAMCDLVWRQIVGWVIRRRLPRCEWQAFVDGLLLQDNLQNTLLERLHQFIDGTGFVPCTDFEFPSDDDSQLAGCGWDFSIDVYGAARGDGPAGLSRTRMAFGIHMSNKSIRLAELMQPQHRHSHASMCVIL